MAEPSPSKLARNKQPSYCGGLTNVWPLLAKQAKDVILTTSRNRSGTRRQELEPAHGTYSLTKHGATERWHRLPHRAQAPVIPYHRSQIQMISVIDLTERKKVEEELRESEGRYREA